MWFPEGLIYEDNYWIAIINYNATRVGMIREELYHYRRNVFSTTLQRNNLKHLDRLKIELMKLEELLKRGLYEAYKQNIEYDFICLYFINTVAGLVNKFDEIPQGIIREMQAVTQKLFPDWRQNALLNQYPQLVMMCQMIDYPFERGDKNEVFNVYMNLKKMYDV